MVDANKNTLLITDLKDSKTLVIDVKGFGSAASPIQFLKDAGFKNASKIVIRDSSGLKTLGGLLPDFPKFNDLLEYLKGIIATHHHKRLYITGASGGGHPALLLGHLLQADKVVAFAPYPYLSLKVAEDKNDPAFVSFRKLLDKFDNLPNDVKPYLDLADVLVNWNGKTKYFVHVSRFHEMDYTRAQYLQGLPKVKIVDHPYETHVIASALKKDNAFKKCFRLPSRQKRAEKNQDH